MYLRAHTYTDRVPKGCILTMEATQEITARVRELEEKVKALEAKLEAGASEVMSLL